MKVTLVVEPARLQYAIEEELDNHHVHLASGQCQCGRFRGKDPAQMRAHAAEEILAVVLRFQVGDDGLSDEEREGYAKRWREGQGAMSTPEEMAELRGIAADLRNTKAREDFFL